jgi:hypothetical protein
VPFPRHWSSTGDENINLNISLKKLNPFNSELEQLLINEAPEDGHCHVPRKV